MKTIEINEKILDKENKVLTDFDFLQIGSLIGVADTLCYHYTEEVLDKLCLDGLLEVHTVIRAIQKLLEDTSEWTTELLRDIAAIKRENLS